jgi:hypothetical protein
MPFLFTFIWGEKLDAKRSENEFFIFCFQKEKYTKWISLHYVLLRRQKFEAKPAHPIWDSASMKGGIDNISYDSLPPFFYGAAT